MVFRREDSPITATYRGLRGDKIVTVGDSKSFSNHQHREVLDLAIKGAALGFTVMERTAAEIDARLMFHVYPETIRLTVSRLIEQLIARGGSRNPQDYLVMLDGETQVPLDFGCSVRAVVDGDKLVWQIGAASILAKVACDARMDELDTQYPEYKFASNRGYPVPAHKKLLKEHGPSPVHRKSFKPVAEVRGLPPGFE